MEGCQDGLVTSFPDLSLLVGAVRVDETEQDDEDASDAEGDCPPNGVDPEINDPVVGIVLVDVVLCPGIEGDDGVLIGTLLLPDLFMLVPDDLADLIVGVTGANGVHGVAKGDKEEDVRSEHGGFKRGDLLGWNVGVSVTEGVAGAADAKNSSGLDFSIQRARNLSLPSASRTW